MTRVLAIACNFMRSAARTKLVFWLAAILVCGIIGLGLSIEGDGTFYGQMRVLLYYTLGLTFTVLGAATIWSSCGEISAEIQNRNIQLLAVKPIRRFEIWLGKWLGLLCLNACLLVMAGITITATAQWQLHFSAAGEQEKRRVRDEVLVARRQLLPAAETSDTEIRDRVSEMLRTQQISPRISRRDIYLSVQKSVLMQKAVVARGASKEWTFMVPEGLSAGEHATWLRYRLYPASPDRTPMKGTWSIGKAGAAASFTTNVIGQPEGTYQFAVPPTSLPAGEAVTVQFKNSDEDGVQSVLFDPGNNVEILIQDAGFVSNLARGLFILFCKLGALSAAGLAAGTLLSFAVASFFIVAMLIAGEVAHYFVSTSSFISNHHGEMPNPSAYEATVRGILERLDTVIGVGSRLSPLASLSDGILITWTILAEALLFLLLAYSAFFFAIGTYFLHRKELALPE